MEDALSSLEGKRDPISTAFQYSFKAYFNYLLLLGNILNFETTDLNINSYLF